MSKGLETATRLRTDALLLYVALLALAPCVSLAAEADDRALSVTVAPSAAPADAEQAESSSDADAKAVVVDLGDGQEYLPPASGPLTVPAEEAAPPSLQATHDTVRPNDPEWVRGGQDDGEPAGGEEAARQTAPESRPPRTRPGDPETPRAVALDEQEMAGAVSGQAASAAVRAAVVAAADMPRFASGDGLDSDAAEVAADMLMAERQRTAGAAAPPANAAEAVDAASAGAEPAAPGVDEEKVKLAAALRDIVMDNPETRASTGKRKADGKTKEPVDAQKRLEELIESIARNKKLLEEARVASRDTTVRGPEGKDTGMRVRDPHARQVLEAMLKDTPLGTVNGAITDGVGKQLAPARVRVTDISETSIQAPLSEGFWCAGNFSVQALSGAAKIEVSRGRFYPLFIKGVQIKPNGATPFEAAMSRPAALNFSAQGWHLADLDMGLRVRPGERAVWLGRPPGLQDLALAAQAEGVRILGVPLPWGERISIEEVEEIAASSREVLLLPVFPGPRHPLYGCGLGLAMSFWDGLPREIGAPEVPLREGFEEIRARGGLGVFTGLNGGQKANIRQDILPLFPQLAKSDFYPPGSVTARLYAAAELPFDVVAGPAFDVLALDGSAAGEQLWFNLLNQGYNISVIGAGGGSLEGGRVPYGQTFVNVDGPLTRDSVADAIRKGRTGVTFGPAVFCKILERDKGPGAALPADGRRLTLQIQAYSSMTQGMQLDKIEIVRNGEVVETRVAADGEAQINNLTWPVSETGTAWYVVRVTERCSALNAKPGRAWSGAVYFRGPAYAPVSAAVSRVKGRLYAGLTPVAGTVTAVVPGQQPRQVTTDNNGNFSLELAASGSLVFEAPGCDPQGVRVFEHPRVRRALGALQTERDGSLQEQFGRASLFPAWRLLLSDLDWEVTLVPSAFRDPERDKK